MGSWMDGWADGEIDGWIDDWMDEWINEWNFGLTDGSIVAWIGGSIDGR